ncbi:ShlB/FhaC/HecB family hemolysin secretion/activation protein [Sphingobium bisphenolivorans]|uniref:ShlB/FhaC/HecB family hemolysin secretion/activation protein n=1 Tax=Sphingobium bisphenolivorans TaxID=1335760 RepID=UPI00039AA238|nr:ShlB/FhaC/HecB family hemolysin secretion/activation protein [Sphingobium bisphenolivorans]
MKADKGGSTAWVSAGLFMMLSICLLLGIALLYAGSARAQEAGSAPIIERERTDRVEPRIAPPPSTSPAPAAPPALTISPAAATRLVRLRYEGASLPVAQLDAATAAFVGLPLSRETLQGVGRAISEAYRRSDIAYYAVSIPPQVPAGGVLTVRIVEGRVRDYRLSGMSPSMPARLIAAHMRRLMREAPLRRSVLERTLSLLRDIPGQTVTAQMRQQGAPGDLVLDLLIARRQLRIRVTIDNSGVDNVVQGVQAQLAVTLNGIAREGDSTRLSGYLPFYPDRYRFYSLSHSTPIGSDGMTLTANGAYMRTRSRDSRSEGEATLAGATIAYPVVRSYRTNLSVSASLDGIDSDNYYLDTRFGDYRSRAVRVGLSWSRVEASSGHALSAVVSQGLDALGARPFTGFSETGFTKVNVQAVAVESLSKRLTLKASVKGQYSGDRLPVTERFPLGGRGAGMAFRVGTLTAEQAVAGSAELAWTLRPKSPLLKNSALFAYVDGAAARATARPYCRLAAQDFSLASAGGGVRLGLGADWRLSAEAAIPIKRPGERYSRKARFFFGLGRSF